MATHFNQYSCLENPLDRGAWQVNVYRVAKNQTWLKWLSMHFHHRIIIFVSQEWGISGGKYITECAETSSRHLKGYFVRIWLPWWLRGLSICLQCRRPGFDPWVGKIPWRRKWQPPPVLLPGKSHGRRSLVGYSPWGCKESDMTERLHCHFVRVRNSDGLGQLSIPARIWNQ